MISTGQNIEKNKQTNKKKVFRSIPKQTNDQKQTQKTENYNNNTIKQEDDKLHEGV